MPTLLTVVPTDATPWHNLLWEDAPGYDVGRAAGSQVWIDAKQVSRHHARIEYRDGDGWWIVDRGSANGITIDGKKVEAARLEGITEVWIADLLCRAVVLTRQELAATHRDRVDGYYRELELAQAPTDAGTSEVLDRLLRSCAKVSGASRGFVLIGSDPKNLALRASLNADEKPSKPGMFSGSMSVVERVLSSGEPVICTDTSSDKSLTGQESIEVGHIRSVICLPLAGPDRQLGALYFDSRESGRIFDSLDLEFLESLAGHAALAIGVQRLQQEVSQARRRAGIGAGRRSLRPETGRAPLLPG